MTTKTKIIISVVALAVSFASGRWLAPTKVKIETKVVEVEKQATSKDSKQDKHKKTTIVEVTKPDGTKEKTTTITDDTSKEDKESKKEETAKTEDTSKEVTRSSARTVVAALAGYQLGGPGTPVYGLHVNREVFGPVGIGVFGLNTGVIGASLSLSF